MDAVTPQDSFPRDPVAEVAGLRVMPLLAGAAAGGAETFFVSLAGALHRAGLSVHPVVRPHADRVAALEDLGLPVRTAPFGRRLDLRTGPRLRQAVQAVRPDVVLAFMNRAAAWMPAGPHVKIARLGGYYDLKYYRRCDHLACITEDIARHVRAGHARERHGRESGWPADRVHVVPNFARVEAAPPVARAAHATPEEAPLLVVPARLHPAKGLDTLLRALVQVPGAYLWIAGAGPERARLDALTANLGLGARVRFLGWREDRGALFRAADAVVFPSHHEPFGTVSLEAWAYEKPLIAADAAGPAALVRPEVDALLVPRADVDALAAALRRVLGDPGLAARLAAAGHARFEAEFTEAACVRRYCEMFARVLQKGGCYEGDERG